MSGAVTPVLVVMGVAGSGKTTVAEALAGRLGCAFKDGDELHPPANIEKMRSGRPLTDADRAPWLAAVADWIEARATAGSPGVISCSALKRRYRAQLADGRPGVRFVYLKVSPEEIARRLAHRTGHFWPAGLAASQFADLEEPAADEPAITVDGERPVEALVADIIARLPVA